MAEKPAKLYRIVEGELKEYEVLSRQGFYVTLCYNGETVKESEFLFNPSARAVIERELVDLKFFKFEAIETIRAAADNLLRVESQIEKFSTLLESVLRGEENGD